MPINCDGKNIAPQISCSGSSTYGPLDLPPLSCWGCSPAGCSQPMADGMWYSVSPSHRQGTLLMDDFASRIAVALTKTLEAVLWCFLPFPPSFPLLLGRGHVSPHSEGSPCRSLLCSLLSVTVLLPKQILNIQVPASWRIRTDTLLLLLVIGALRSGGPASAASDARLRFQTPWSSCLSFGALCALLFPDLCLSCPSTFPNLHLFKSSPSYKTQLMRGNFSRIPKVE